MEAALTKIGHLKNLEHLRLVISNDTEFEIVQENANERAEPPGERANVDWRFLVEEFGQKIRKVVLEMLSNLANQLTRLELNGGWICDNLVMQMPCLPNLEALRLIPSLSRVVIYGQVSAQSYLQF